MREQAKEFWAFFLEKQLSFLDVMMINTAQVAVYYIVKAVS